MSTQVNIILGFPYREFHKLRDRAGAPIAVDLDDTYGFQEDGRVVAINESLSQVHRLACEDMGWKFLGHGGRFRSEHFPVYETDAGERALSPFSLEILYDPGEMGEMPEHAVAGVPLTSRYKPTFLDYEDASGGLWLIVMDEELTRRIRIARARISGVLPCFREAKVCVKEMFY